MDIKIHFEKQMVGNGQANVNYVNSDNDRFDRFTKTVWNTQIRDFPEGSQRKKLH